MSKHVNDPAVGMPGTKRVTVEEAAKILGLSSNAVRKRLERGTLRGEKIGAVRYVVLTEDDMSTYAEREANDMSGDIALMREYLDSMRLQIDYLKAVINSRDEEMRRKDHLLAASLERIPAIGVSAEPRDSPVAPSGSQDGGAEGEPGRMSWWMRWFR